jgi:D-cysteine desulfhydrase
VGSSRFGDVSREGAAHLFVRLGDFPTPVERLSGALGPGRDLWVKRDDLTNPRYGGNKVRKLERLLDSVRARGSSRIVTVGAAGSHHALATALFARDASIDVEAVLVPQPDAPHVRDNLRATAARARVFAASSFPHAATIVVDRIACGAFYIPPGGSNAQGTLAYADAARELALQVERGELPLPRTVVVTLGSGGTAAGIAAGLASLGLECRVLGVVVAEPPFWLTRHARRLAKACLRELRPEGGAAPLQLESTTDYLGPGYGHPTPIAHEALLDGARRGLLLDMTYTAKTYAAARALPEEHDPVVYWHTLSSAPLAPLLEGVPPLEALAPELASLLV